jgi:hypothetical protein
LGTLERDEATTEWLKKWARITTKFLQGTGELRAGFRSSVQELIAKLWKELLQGRDALPNEVLTEIEPFVTRLFKSLEMLEA